MKAKVLLRWEQKGARSRGMSAAEGTQTRPGFAPFKASLQVPISLFPDAGEMPDDSSPGDHLDETSALTFAMRFQTRWQILRPAQVMTSMMIPALKMK
jgi:hypothetical protein